MQTHRRHKWRLSATSQSELTPPPAPTSMTMTARASVMRVTPPMKAPAPMSANAPGSIQAQGEGGRNTPGGALHRVKGA